MRQESSSESLRVLSITPLRALANDARSNLESACTALDIDVRVEIRTGDTSTTQRTKQRNKPPYVLGSREFLRHAQLP